MSEGEFFDMLLTANRQCELAIAVYEGEGSVATLAERVGARYRNFKCANTAAAALIFEDHVHLVFCGTNDASDWAQNLNTSLADAGGYDVHQGFLNQAQWIAGAIGDSDFYRIIGHRRLIIGGHSAGGAIAEIIPLIEPRIKKCLASVFTFGAPKSMARQSAAKYMSLGFKAYGFSMNGDPIPYVPLSLVSLLRFGKAYSHASQGLYLKDAGSVQSTSGLTLIGKLLGIAKTFYLTGLTTAAVFVRQLPSLLKAHSIYRYHAGITKAMDLLDE